MWFIRKKVRYLSMREEFIKTPAVDLSKPFCVENAGISYCDGSYGIYRRKSDVAVIEYIIKGTGTIETKNKIYTPIEGDTYLLSPGVEHRYYSSSDDPWVKLWINVTGTLAESLIKVYGLENQIIYKCNSKNHIEKMHSILKDDKLSLDEILSKCSIAFHELMLLLQSHTDKNVAIPEDVLKMKTYIDTNISENITIDTLSALIYKSHSQTIRIFKNAYGITPLGYHMQTRITKAISLLGGTNLSVRDIAYSLGFSDEHYFSSLFKQKTGKRPTDFRKSKE